MQTTNVDADHDGNTYKYNPSTGAQQHTSSGWQQASDANVNSLRQSADARSQGSQRWNNFHPGGAGGGWGSSASRGGWAAATRAGSAATRTPGCCIDHKETATRR